MMKKIRFGVGGVLMIAAMLVSDSLRVAGVYAIAAVLHEIGHLLAARVLRIKIKEIKLGFSGVRIVTDERLTSYGSEIILAVAGPLANAVAFVASLCCFQPYGGLGGMWQATERFMSGGEGELWGAVGFFALSSVVQAAVNLLPVESFDGGRVIYCITARLINETFAARMLSVTTALSSFILWTVALYLMLRVSAGLGIYVFAACIFASTLRARAED